MAGLLPRWITRWSRHNLPPPWLAVATLVVGGEYRYVRNPIYIGIEAIVLGQAALFAGRAWWPRLRPWHPG